MIACDRRGMRWVRVVWELRAYLAEILRGRAEKHADELHHAFNAPHPPFTRARTRRA